MTKGERLKEEKFRTKHVEDTTSLALISKREIYEKLINNKSEGDVKEGDLGETKEKWETDQQAATKDQEYSERMQQLRGILWMKSITEDLASTNEYNKIQRGSYGMYM